ncbi:hypothetical protein PYW07_012570 [Mythimna separata]|uniref:FAM193 C-terminal domain-containing protein n=1 Tax=Mythimna separata TaxID=271217 RepID=A0AAD8DLF4_MYTSE|nr:hypothetical protein PYW07_012570 [Mythimna separata]
MVGRFILVSIASITNLSTLEVSEREIESFKRFDFYFEPPQHKPKVQLDVSEREIESFKRFDFYFEPPQHKPKVQLDVRDIAAALRQNQK